MSTPKAAWVNEIGITQCKSLPSRSKNGCSFTCRTTYKSPGGPPWRPPSPYPVKRMRVPSSTPAGIAATSPCAAAKNLAQAEEVAEDIAQIGSVEAYSSTTAQPRMAETIVDRTLLAIS